MRGGSEGMRGGSEDKAYGESKGVMSENSSGSNSLYTQHHLQP